MNKNIIVAEDTKAPQTVDTLIELAIKNNVPPENLEKLMAMRRELRNEWAKGEYDKAMSEFQADCPVIKKGKQVKFNTKTGSAVDYAYAPLEAIVSQVGGLLAKYGFSYSFKLEEDAKGIKVTCIAKHVSGHSDTSTFVADLAGTSLMSNAQVSASKATYGKRQSFCNVFGITTGDTDIDAIKTKTEAVSEVAATEEQWKTIDELTKKAGLTQAEFSTGIRKHYGLKSVTHLTKVQADGAIQMLHVKISGETSAV